MCWGETGVLEPPRTLADPTPRGGEREGLQGLFVWTGGCASQPGHGGAASALSRRFSPAAWLLTLACSVSSPGDPVLAVAEPSGRGRSRSLHRSGKGLGAEPSGGARCSRRASLGCLWGRGGVSATMSRKDGSHWEEQTLPGWEEAAEQGACMCREGAGSGPWVVQAWVVGRT